VKDALLGRGMADQVGEFVGRIQSKAITFDLTHTLFFLAGDFNDRQFGINLTSIVAVRSVNRELGVPLCLGEKRSAAVVLVASEYSNTHQFRLPDSSSSTVRLSAVAGPRRHCPDGSVRGGGVGCPGPGAGALNGNA
jgi:hypothetical protein